MGCSVVALGRPGGGGGAALRSACQAGRAGVASDPQSRRVRTMRGSAGCVCAQTQASAPPRRAAAGQRGWQSAHPPAAGRMLGNRAARGECGVCATPCPRFKPTYVGRTYPLGVAPDPTWACVTCAAGGHPLGSLIRWGQCRFPAWLTGMRVGAEGGPPPRSDGRSRPPSSPPARRSAARR
jgi:hypothetical protein